MEWPQISEKLQSAKDDFMANDRHLLEVDANERSMTHLFAEHLKVALRDSPDWNVDCEYNRDGTLVKRLPLAPGEKAQAVVPDIIVHYRGRQLEGDRGNLLVIEAKKSDGDNSKDRKKLLAFKNGRYHYSFAVLLRFVTGERPDIEIEAVDHNPQEPPHL